MGGGRLRGEKLGSTAEGKTQCFEAELHHASLLIAAERMEHARRLGHRSLAIRGRNVRDNLHHKAQRITQRQ